MPYSFVEYTGDGTTTNFSVTFPYISQDHVSVEIDGSSTSFTWNNASTVTVSPAPANGAVVQVIRDSQANNSSLDFSDGAIILEEDLDSAFLKLLYLAQEALDVKEVTISKLTDGTFDAVNARIRNVGTPTENTDAATKAYADSIGTAMAASAAAAASSASLAGTHKDAAEAAKLSVDSSVAQVAADLILAAGHKDAAETAKDAAETAKSDAETAQTLAENALSAIGLRLTFDSGTANSDPGTGKFRFDNSTPASATAIYIDNQDTTGATISGHVDLWDDITNSGARGTLLIRGIDDPTDYLMCKITGAVTNETTHRSVIVSDGVGSGAFSNGEDYLFQFSVAGADGADGQDGANGAGSGDLLAANNLSDLANAATARTNLGLGALATAATVGTSQLDDDAVTLAKMQDISGDRILGRNDSSSGAIEELTYSQVKSELGLGALSELDTVSATEIDDGTVTLAKMATADLSGTGPKIMTGATGSNQRLLALDSNGDVYVTSLFHQPPSQAQAEAGTDTIRPMTAQRTAQAIAALASGGGGFKSVQVFTASGTWTRPSGITKILIFATGGGAGGGPTSSQGGGGGGGAGGTAIRFLDVSSISSAAVTIGAGGGGNANGSATTFGSYATGSGGTKGGTAVSPSAAAGGAGGAASNGDLNIPGGPGGSGTSRSANTPTAGHGGSSFWGGGGYGGAAAYGNVWGGAASVYGAGGGGGNFTAAGEDGVVFVMEFE